MNDALLLCHYECISLASAYGFPMPRADCCPSPLQRPILLIMPCADVTKRDDLGIRIRHAESLAHRSMTVSAVIATFKSP
jgi:hypothetical protein